MQDVAIGDDDVQTADRAGIGALNRILPEVLPFHGARLEQIVKGEPKNVIRVPEPVAVPARLALDRMLQLA